MMWLTSNLEFWSAVWRGAVGGIFGWAAFILYLFFFDTYRLNELGTFALIALGNGSFVGAVIFILGRTLGKKLGILLRVIVGVVLSFFSMSLFSYLGGGWYGDLKWFVTNAILLAVTLGGFAGAMARVKSPQT